MATSGDTFRRYPFLRPLVALVFGIILGRYIYNIGECHTLISALHSISTYLFAALAAILIILFYLVRRHPTRWLFGALLALALLLLGATLSTKQLSDVTIRLTGEKMVYSAHIIDKPVEKGRTMLAHALLTARNDSNKMVHLKPQPMVMIYFHKDSASQELRMNDKILINTTLTMPSTNSMISRYSYHDYLLRNGISATAYVDSMGWRINGHTDRLSLRQRADISRDSLMGHYRSLGFKGDNLAVLSAITLGYRESLDKDLQESYSIAGVSHVLAISGMHIGFICALLMLLMRIVPSKLRAITLVKNMTAILLLWCYVYLIGFPISAVRASTMFSIYMFVAVFRNDKRASVNALLLTALLMLMARPLWLFDVGFQLSFFSVASILIFLPLLNRIYSPRNRLKRYLWALFSVTIVAQLGTAPLTMLYFYRMPTLFLLANPIVIILMTLIVYGVMLMAALCFLPAVQWYAATAIDHMLTWLNSFVRVLSLLPHSSVDNIFIRPYECALLYIIFIAIALFVIRHNVWRLVVLCLSITAFVGCRLQFIMTTHPANAIYLYSCNGTPVVHCTSRSGESWVVCDTTRRVRAANFAPFCAAHRLNTPHIVSGDYADSHLATHNQMIRYKRHTIVLLTDNRWQRSKSSKPLAVDCIYVGRSFAGNISKTLELFRPRTIVADKQPTEERDRLLHERCREKSVICNTISEEGSISIML